MAFALNKLITSDFYLNVSRGLIPGYSIVNKFGKNPAIGTSPVAVCIGGLYQTPTSATTLRIKAGGNANDTANGSGAREITLTGLDADFNEQTVTLATNGASASSATSATFLRLYRAYVSSSGTYGTAAAGSHSGSIVIENGAGGTDWATIDATTFPRGQAQIGAYTVPAGKTAYLISQLVFVDSTKPATIMFFQRQSANDIIAPYSAIRLVNEVIALGGQFTIEHTGYTKFPEKTDIGYLAFVAATTSSTSVEFDLLLVDNAL